MYRIQSGASDKFVIGSTTGKISVANGATLDPDLSEPKTTGYSLSVVCSFQGLSRTITNAYSFFSWH